MSGSGKGREGEANYGQLGLFLALLTVWRLALAVWMPMGVDESYAVAVSRSLSLSYFDHPPMAFTMARLSALAFGSEAAFAYRLPFVVMSLATTALIYDLTRIAYGHRAGMWAAAWFAVTPFFAVASFSVLPDGPLLLFLAATIRLVLPLIIAPAPTAAASRWLMAGVFFGAALLSKYLAVLTAVASLALLLRAPSGRRQLGTVYPYLAAVIAILIFLPVIFWNYTTGFASFAFQAGRAGNAAGSLIGNGVNLLRMIGGNLLYFLPLIFAIPAAIRAFRSSPEAPGAVFATLGLVPIAILLAIAALSKGSLPHWTSAGWLFLTPILGAMSAESLTPARLKKAWIATAGAVSLAALLAGALTRGFLPGLPVSVTYQAMREMGDWQPFVDELDRRGILSDREAYLVIDHWISAAKLGATLDGRLPMIVSNPDHRHFGFMKDTRMAGRSTAYLLSLTPVEKLDERQAALIASHPAQPGEIVEVAPPLILMLGADPVMALAVVRVLHAVQSEN